MDIVERLKWRIHTSHDVNALTNEAADEIERLREVAKDRPKDRPNEAADEIERLRKALKTFADNVRETDAEIDKNWAKTIYPLKAENQRLREALKEILAHETDYEPYDCIEIARTALKEDE